MFCIFLLSATDPSIVCKSLHAYYPRCADIMMMITGLFIFYRFAPRICRKKNNPSDFYTVYFIEKFNKLSEKFRHYVKSNYATVLEF